MSKQTQQNIPINDLSGQRLGQQTGVSQQYPQTGSGDTSGYNQSGFSGTQYPGGSAGQPWSGQGATDINRGGTTSWQSGAAPAVGDRTGMGQGTLGQGNIGQQGSIPQTGYGQGGLVGQSSQSCVGQSGFQSGVGQPGLQSGVGQRGQGDITRPGDFTGQGQFSDKTKIGDETAKRADIKEWKSSDLSEKQKHEQTFKTTNTEAASTHDRTHTRPGDVSKNV
jgi:hypothetical protein